MNKKELLQQIKNLMEPYAEKLRSIGIKTEWTPEYTSPYCSIYQLLIDKNDVDVGYITVLKPKNKMIVCFAICSRISEQKTITFDTGSTMAYTLYHYTSFNEEEFDQVFNWCCEIVKFVKEFRQKETEMKIRNDF